MPPVGGNSPYWITGEGSGFRGLKVGSVYSVVRPPVRSPVPSPVPSVTPVAPTTGVVVVGVSELLIARKMKKRAAKSITAPISIFGTTA